MAEPSSVYVFDTFAVIAHFEAESGGEKVKELKYGANYVNACYI